MPGFGLILDERGTDFYEHSILSETTRKYNLAVKTLV